VASVVVFGVVACVVVVVVVVVVAGGVFVVAIVVDVVVATTAGLTVNTMSSLSSQLPVGHVTWLPLYLNTTRTAWFAPDGRVYAMARSRAPPPGGFKDPMSCQLGELALLV
jgi:hypothetical protein